LSSQRPLSDQKKRVRLVIYDEICGENVLKIGPVDPEIILLEDVIKKKKRN